MHNLIIDFDSTFVSVEGLEELASLALAGRKDAGGVLDEIKRITNLGMAGKLSFTKSLEKRLGLLKADRKMVADLAGSLKGKVSPSFARNKKFFKDESPDIYIISGGFRDFIEPVLLDFGIRKENIFANDFIYDEKNSIIGFDRENVLSLAGGKALKIKSLGLKKAVVLGDGYTDYEIKKAGFADKFFAYTENIGRKEVVALADGVYDDFGKFIKDLYLLK